MKLNKVSLILIFAAIFLLYPFQSIATAGNILSGLKNVTVMIQASDEVIKKGFSPSEAKKLVEDKIRQNGIIVTQEGGPILSIQLFSSPVEVGNEIIHGLYSAIYIVSHGVTTYNPENIELIVAWSQFSLQTIFDKHLKISSEQNVDSLVDEFLVEYHKGNITNNK